MLCSRWLKMQIVHEYVPHPRPCWTRKGFCLRLFCYNYNLRSRGGAAGEGLASFWASLKVFPRPCYKFCIPPDTYNNFVALCLHVDAMVTKKMEEKQKKKHRKSTTCNAENLNSELGLKFLPEKFTASNDCQENSLVYSKQNEQNY